VPDPEFCFRIVATSVRARRSRPEDVSETPAALGGAVVLDGHHFQEHYLLAVPSCLGHNRREEHIEIDGRRAKPPMPSCPR
jgi:hypothetical protein